MTETHRVRRFQRPPGPHDGTRARTGPRVRVTKTIAKWLQTAAFRSFRHGDGNARSSSAGWAALATSKNSFNGLRRATWDHLVARVQHAWGALIRSPCKSTGFAYTAEFVHPTG
jgi:hypothetical protein